MTATADGILEFNPWDYAIHEDPYPTYGRLRAEHPVYRNDDLDFWALSRHEDVVAVFRDSERFSNRYGVSLDRAAWGEQAHRSMSFLAMDPPRHTRMRALVSKGFTPRRVVELEPRIRLMAAELAGEAVEKKEFDIISDIAGRLPMDVISEMIGVPQADRQELRRLADLLLHRVEGVEDVPPEGIAAALDMVVYFTEMIAERRRVPTDDLTSALLWTDIEGDRLTDDELVSFLFLMVVAGNETTTKMIGNAWYWASRFPDQRRAALQEAARAASWVEETLRFDNSTQILARLVATDVEIRGTQLRRGERALLLIGSANRDPDVWPDADRYDLDREFGTRTASFGNGRHFCMGASLARIEGRIVLEELQALVRDYEVDEEHSERVHSINVRGFSRLPTSVLRR
jgi:cytochrome P450